MNRDSRGWMGMFRVATAAAALVASAGLALAQPNAPKDDGALKGPKVKDEGAPGKNRKFTEKGGTRAEDREVPMRQFARAFQALKPGKQDKKLADGLALTTDQENTIQKIVKDYGTDIESFRKENADEVRELVKILPPEDRRKVMAKLAAIAPQRDGAARPADGERPQRPANGERPQRPGQDDPMMDAPAGPKASQADIDVAINRLKEIGDAIPKASEAQAKMWAVLSDAQKPIVKAELEKMKADAEKRRNEGGGEGMDRPGMSPEMREKLKDMSPEERQKAMEEFRKNRPADAKKPGQGKGGNDAKPNKKPVDKSTPPGMDTVVVPKPKK